MDSTLYHSAFRDVPDEVMENILSYNLTISYGAFCSPERHFGKFDLSDVSSSAVIEVCKHWMRIGTPLLYETVVLRSKAQVLALRAALDGNPALCKYIKRLRVEDTYGMAIADVMQMCSAVTDVWISLRLQANGLETGKGLQKGLKYLNPKTLILWDYSLGKSRPWSLRVPIFDALKGTLPLWKRLETIRYLSEPGYMEHWAQSLFRGLHELCLKLKYIYFADFHFSEHPSLLSNLAQIKTLQKIWILEDDFSSSSASDLDKATSEKYKDILKKVAVYRPLGSQYPTGQAPAPLAESSPSSVNYAALNATAPFMRMFILLNILQHWPGTPNLHDPDDTGLWQGPAFRALSQVCRDFRNVVLPYLYTDIELNTPTQCSALEQMTRLGYGVYIRHIRGDISALLQCPEFVDILRRAPNLVSLQNGPMVPKSRGVTRDQLSVISIVTGNRLCFLDVPIVDAPGPPSLIDWSSLSVSLWGLRNLRELEWTCQEQDDSQTLDYTVYKDALPRLKHLTYASTSGNLMRFLNRLDLQNLTQVVIKKAPDVMSNTCHDFLETHGQILDHLDLPFKSVAPDLFTDLCPELLSLKLDVAGKSSVPNSVTEVFNNVRSNECLKELFICTSEEKIWWDRELRFLESADFSGFSALHSIHLETYEWPTEQCAIAKSLMVRLAEKWWLERKVRMVDKNGIAWKPRLKTPTSTKRAVGKKQLVTLT